MNRVERILTQKVLAFSLVAVSALGTVTKEQWGIKGCPFLDAVLITCFVVGLWLWIGSKRLERRNRREEEEREE
jgi:hypothetical protein